MIQERHGPLCSIRKHIIGMLCLYPAMEPLWQLHAVIIISVLSLYQWIQVRVYVFIGWFVWSSMLFICSFIHSCTHPVLLIIRFIYLFNVFMQFVHWFHLLSDWLIVVPYSHGSSSFLCILYSMFSFFHFIHIIAFIHLIHFIWFTQFGFISIDSVHLMQEGTGLQKHQLDIGKSWTCQVTAPRSLLQYTGEWCILHMITEWHGHPETVIGIGNPWLCLLMGPQCLQAHIGMVLFFIQWMQVWLGRLWLTNQL
jgi:hypothetical protein